MIFENPYLEEITQEQLDIIWKKKSEGRLVKIFELIKYLIGLMVRM